MLSRVQRAGAPLGRRFILGFAALAASLFIACGSDSESPQQVARPVPPERPDFEALVTGPRSADGLQAILGTGDLAIGLHRLGFVLTSAGGFVTAPDVSVVPRFKADGEGSWSTGSPVQADFHPWPYGSRGLYTLELSFETAGTAALDISVLAEDGAAQTTELEFAVKPRTYSPSVGEAAPDIASKTFAEVSGFGELTTGSLNDADLYQTSLGEAVSSGDPTVVVFASPAFCTNAVCGPQVEVLQQIKDLHKGRANFVHVDFYDNPHEIQGDLERGRVSPVVREWGLPSIEWTFVIDAQGVVVARFEGFATFEEVESALMKVL